MKILLADNGRELVVRRGRMLCGIRSHRLTTRVVVGELPITEREYLWLLRSRTDIAASPRTRNEAWALADSARTEARYLLNIAARFEVGAVLERQGQDFVRCN